MRYTKTKIRIYKNKNKNSSSIYKRNEVIDLQPNEPDSAPPITGAIDGPTYFKIRNECISKHIYFKLFSTHQWTKHEKTIKTSTFSTIGYISNHTSSYRR